ncbi:MAG: MFS transporter [Myxococcota bacterium]
MLQPWWSPRSEAGKLTLLASLYISQGLPYGFLTQAVPTLLRQQGASLTQIGDASLLMLPWLLKFLWAPTVDRTWSASVGRRRSWILPLQALTALTLGSLALADPTNAIPLLLGVTWLTALFSSTQDIATDGLAVSLLTERERGLGNGVQVAGYRLGMVIGGGALLVVFSRVGWSASFLAMAGLLVLATLPTLVWREPTHDETAEGPAETLRQVFTRPGMPTWLGLLVVYKVGEQLGGAVTKPMLVDLHLDLETIGWLGAADSGASLMGALTGGWLTGRMTRRRALVGFGLLQATGVLAWVLPVVASPTLSTIAAVKVYDGFVGSMATAALFTAMMDACRPSSGGTDYTVQASVVLVAGFLGAALGGRTADALIAVLGGNGPGYAAHFALATALTIVGALVIGAVRTRPVTA